MLNIWNQTKKQTKHMEPNHYRLFRPVRSDQSTDAKTHFIKLDFINKGIDAVNLPSINPFMVFDRHLESGHSS